MFESILISAVTVAIGGVMTYVIIKKTVSVDYMLEVSDVLLDELANNTEMQKKVYILGVLLGNGIKSGVGLTKGKGKFKLDDLVGMGIRHFFGNMFEGKEGAQPQPSKSSGDVFPKQL